MGSLVVGDRLFTDRGILGVGIPNYTRAQGYTPFEIPTAVGARMFNSPDFSDFDDETDQPIPIAKGNKWDGGRPAYQQRVYNAKKKLGKQGGYKQSDLDASKPRQVA